jgi:hypothetical protein
VRGGGGVIKLLFSAGDHWLIRSNISAQGNIYGWRGREGGGIIYKLFREIDGTT